MAERNIDIKRQHLVAPLLPGVSGQAVAQGPVDIVDGGVKPGLKLLVGLTGSPVGLVTAAQVERGGTPQLLGDAELYPAALVVREVVVIGELRFHFNHAILGLDVVAAHPVIGGVGEAEIAARRVAVAHQLNVGAGIRQRLVIEETHRLPLMLAVIGQGGVGLGDIQRQRPQLPHVFADAEVKGAVAIRQLGAAVQGPARRKTAHYGALEKFRFFLLIAAAAVLPGGDRIAGMALALEHRHGRVRDGENLAAAVGLFDGHLQVAAVAGGVEIVDGERAGGHRALVDLIAVLLHRHLSGAAGNPVDNRGKSLLAVRQHVVIGGELRAAEVNAVEDVAVGVAVAQGQTRAQRGDVALQPGIDVLPLVFTGRRTAAAAVAPGGVIAQTPGAEIQPALQVQVRVIAAAADVVMDVVAGEVVVQQPGVNPVVPEFGRNIAAGAVAHKRLGYGQVQPLQADIEAGSGVLDGFG
ncbi:Uncharacterised protein [Klebsiella oxytoca]|nr:Uncharacterised protein [Klebsiella oxytoca]